MNLPAPAPAVPAWTLRGALDLCLKLSTLTAVLSAGFFWLVEPRIQPFVDVVGAVAGITTTLDGMTREPSSLTGRIEALERRAQSRNEPILQFAQFGNSIGSGAAGSTVVMRWHFSKLREECGAPTVDAFLEVPLESPEEPMTLRFQSVGIVNETGRGAAYPAGPGTVAYPVTIPSLAPEGKAAGWVDLTYPDCPGSPRVRSPRVPFQIVARAG